MIFTAYIEWNYFFAGLLTFHKYLLIYFYLWKLIGRTSTRFCKILQDLIRFCKIQQGSAKFCKIQQDSVKFCKIEQDFARFIKIL